MLRRINDLQGLTIRATDGEIGKVDQFLFDDETWAVRYLVVDTSHWMPGRQVLISPISIGRTDWEAKRLEVKLTKRQVEQSPDIDTHKPVSRQHEAAFFNYYRYARYWGGPFLWGPVALPAGVVVPQGEGAAAAMPTTAAPVESEDVHLRSTEEVTDYHIQAVDGEIGYVEDFIVDDENWAIRYLVVDTRNWWPSKKVLIPPPWIDRMSWEQSKVYANLTRAEIKKSPEYDESAPVTREYEMRLYNYYGRSPYWH